MPNIVTALELARFLKLKDNDGNDLVPRDEDNSDPDNIISASDPSLTYLNDILNSVESIFEQRTYHSYGHYTQVVEYHDLIYEFQTFKGVPVFLAHIDCVEIDAEQGDYVKIKINNRLADAQGSIDDFNLQEGKMWIRHYGIIDRQPRLEVKYRYGIPPEKVPEEIKFAIKKLAFIHIVESDLQLGTIDYANQLGSPVSSTLDKWREDINDVVARHRVMSYGR